jgi:Kef-type K+ transport system membrane component KefB
MALQSRLTAVNEQHYDTEYTVGERMTNQPLAVAVMLLGGFFAGILFRRLRLPGVTAYILFGLLLSPSVFNIIPPALDKELALIKTLGLGVIALIVGGELKLQHIRHLRRSIFYATAGLSVMTFSLVFCSMYLFARLPFPIALLLGVTATATAPAPVIAVIKELRAGGPLTSTMLGSVAVADAMAILLFGVVSAVVATSLAGASASLFRAFVFTAQELLGSLLLGVLSGVALVLFAGKYKDKNQRLLLLLAVILLNSGISQAVHFSALLVNLICGITVANLHKQPHHFFSVLEVIETLLFIAFFTLAGASLRLDTLVANWPVALVYIVARTTGVISGVTAGTFLSGADGVVRRYLGRSLLSKAGVTIGLVLLIQSRFPEIAAVVTAVELSAITAFELVGPVITRNSLIRAGEAGNLLERQI